MKTINLGNTQVAATLAKIHVTNEAPTIGVHCIATGAPSSIIVNIEGSFDGTNFGVIDSHTFSAGELTALSSLFYVIDKPILYVRVSIATLTLIARALADIVVTGTGDGVLATYSAVDSAPVETWTVLCTVGGAGGTFTVTGSVSGAQAAATSAVAYDNSIVAFTITDGAADWVAGDTIVFDVEIVGGVTTLVRYDDI